MIIEMVMSANMVMRRQFLEFFFGLFPEPYNLFLINPCPQSKKDTINPLANPMPGFAAIETSYTMRERILGEVFVIVLVIGLSFGDVRNDK